MPGMDPARVKAYKTDIRVEEAESHASNEFKNEKLKFSVQIKGLLGQPHVS